MIRFEHVTKMFGDRVVLNDLSFELRRGEVFVIVGSSGSGKSVTLKHMVRLLTPTDGRIWLGDQDIVAANNAQLEELRNRFGYLFQGGALLAWMSVAGNVALPLLEKTDLSRDAIEARVGETLALVGLEADGDKMPSEISGGMQKRAGLARAIIRQPEIVLYDEPTSGLDPVTSRVVDRLITRLNRELGVTSVVVTHDLHSALAIGHRIAMLSEGTFIELATPEAFVASPKPEVQAFLEAQFITVDGPWKRKAP